MRLSMQRPEITHIDFSDEPIWDGSMTAENWAGRMQTIADTRKWVRGFFDATIREDNTLLKQLMGEG